MGSIEQRHTLRPLYGEGPERSIEMNHLADKTLPARLSPRGTRGEPVAQLLVVADQGQRVDRTNIAPLGKSLVLIRTAGTEEEQRATALRSQDR